MNKRDIAAVVFLFLAVAAVYAPALAAPFVYDDFDSIVDNAFIRHPANIRLLFSPDDYFAGARKPRYRPVSAALYFAGYGLWGLNPLGQRLIKIVLHQGNAWLVYLLVGRLLRARRAGLVAALIFALHPVQTEAVDCIAFNDDLLATGFLLASLHLIRRALERASPAALGVGLLAYLAALLSKETALVLLPLLLLQEFCFPPRYSWRRGFVHAALLSVTLLYLFLRFFVFPGPAVEAATPPWGIARCSLIARSAAQYLRLLLFPARLSLDYSLPVRSLAFSISLPPLVLAATVAALVLLRTSILSRRFFWASGWLILPLLPALHLIPLPQVLAERYLYMSVIGFGTMAALAAGSLAGAGMARALSVGLLLPLALLTFSRNRAWTTPDELWRRTLLASPDSPVAHNNLGWSRYLKGDDAGAAAEFRKAIESRPSRRAGAVAYANLAVLAGKRGDYGLALEMIALARDLHPASPRVFREEGYLRLRRREYREAAKSLLEALEINPYDYQSYNLLGCVMAEIGNPAEAKKYFQRSAYLNPDDPSAAENLSRLDRKHGLLITDHRP